MLTSISIQSRKSGKSVLKKKREATMKGLAEKKGFK